MEVLMRKGNSPQVLGENENLTIAGRECVTTQVNYIRNTPNELTGFYPIFHASPNDKLGDTPEVARNLYSSFISGRDCKGRDDYMPIDEGHQSLMGGSQKELGYVIDLAILDESEDGQIITYSDKGEVITNPLESGSVHLLGKIAWPVDELENIKNGVYGKKFSVAFDANKPETLLNVALCQVPAKEGVPTLEVRSKGKFKSRICDIDLKGDDMQKRITDEGLASDLTGMLTSLAMPQPDIDIILTISDEAGLILKNGLTPQEPAPQEPVAQESTNPLKEALDNLISIVNDLTGQVKSTNENVENLKTKHEDLEKRWLEVDPSKDESFRCAKNFFIERGYSNDISTAKAYEFRGSGLSKEKIEGILGSVAPAQETGSKVEKVDIKPVETDPYLRAKELANEKFNPDSTEWTKFVIEKTKELKGAK